MVPGLPGASTGGRKFSAVSSSREQVGAACAAALLCTSPLAAQNGDGGVPRTAWGDPAGARTRDLADHTGTSVDGRSDRRADEGLALRASALVSRQRMEGGHPGVREPVVPFYTEPER